MKLLIYWLVLLQFDLFGQLTYQLIRLNNSNQSANSSDFKVRN